MHMGGDASLEDLQWENRRWNGSQAYADTKFHGVVQNRPFWGDRRQAEAAGP
jgi:hypothetical protein